MKVKPLADRVLVKNDKAETKTSSGIIIPEAAQEKTPGISSAELRKKIATAIKIQRKRQGKKNVFLTPAEIADFCKLTEEAKKLLDTATARNDFSPRAVSGCMKLARTIADMEEKEIIDAVSMEEAINYRKVATELMN